MHDDNANIIFDFCPDELMAIWQEKSLKYFLDEMM